MYYIMNAKVIFIKVIHLILGELFIKVIELLRIIYNINKFVLIGDLIWLIVAL